MSLRVLLAAALATSLTANTVRSQTFADLPFVGVTIDRLEELDRQLRFARRIPSPRAFRVVFDFGLPPEHYAEAIRKISKVGAVLAAPVDSSDLPRYDVAAYRRRFETYVQAFGDAVAAWEVGNEVNGDWVGRPETTAAKVTAALDVVERSRGRSVLTLYYGTGCIPDPALRWEHWSRRNLPEKTRARFSFVGFSFYPEDCPNVRPRWTREFSTLATLYPKATLGLAEIGAERSENKLPTLQRFLALRENPPHGKFVGGYFWWQFSTDALVPAFRRGFLELY